MNDRRTLLAIILTGMFVTNAVVAELISGKLFTVGPFTLTCGVLLWPVVFLTTDVVNEYFGRHGVRRLTLTTVVLIGYVFLILLAAMQVVAAPFSPVNDEQFTAVFGQGSWIIVGSMTAFAVSQLVDVAVFWVLRRWTGGKMIWLRATGSTGVSQLVDTFVVMGIAFWLPGKLTTVEFLTVSMTNYGYKLILAIGLTPLVYAMHAAVRRFLGDATASEMASEAARLG